MRSIYLCDICGKEVRETEWYTHARSLTIAVSTPSQNPMGKLPYKGCNFQNARMNIEEVCPNCSHKIAKTITDTFLELLPSEKGEK